VIDGDERALMEETVRAALAEAVAAGSGADAVLAKLGWRELHASEPDDAIAIVFGALGATNAAATALDDVLAAALGVEPRAECAVLLPRFGAWEPPGRAGLATARVAAAEELLVVSGTPAEPRLARVPIGAARVRSVRGIDPAAGLYEARVEGSAGAATPLAPDAWGAAVTRAQRALGHQLLGAARTMLDLAKRHAQERTQFGRPIARFQAVRHRLADAFVAVESLAAALAAARDVPTSETAALAKACAGRTTQTVARHAQQVLAGIGFTTEHAFHRYLRRTLVLEGLFGSADAIVLDTGRRLLAERRVETLIEL
jgi:hypothetical protein